MDIQAKIQAVKESARKRAEENLAKARLALLENENYISTLVEIEGRKMKQEKLQESINSCKAIIDSHPVFDEVRRQNRKWAGRYLFAFGDDINLLYQLSTGVLYSGKEHRDLMLAVTGLDLASISGFIESVGRPAYYSKSLGAIVPEEPYNASKARAYALVLGEALGVVPDVSKLTEEGFNAFFRREKEKAELQYEEARLDGELEEFTLS